MTNLEDALAKLDRLTQEEARMADAEDVKHTRVGQDLARFFFESPL